MGAGTRDGYERFLELARTDPLFAAEGMDLERASGALDAIEEQTQELEKRWSADSFIRRLFFIRFPVARYAIPVPFLRDFIESERARRAFLAAPDISSAHELILRWKDTQKSLARSVERYTKLHHILFRLDEKAKTKASIQDMLGNVTTPEDVAGLLRLFRKNALSLQAEVADRKSLLEGPQIGRRVSAVRTRAADEAHFSDAKVKPEYLHLHRLELLHWLPFRHGKIVESCGPFSYTLAHFDGTPSPHTFMVYIVRNDTTGVLSLRVSALDAFRFIPLTDSDDAKFPPVGRAAFESLIKRGIPYWYQSVTSPYATRDDRYWADIATAADLRRRPALDSALVFSQKSSMFDLLLGACIEDHEIFIENIEERKGLWYWLLYRTHPSIYYLPFNASVWRIDDRPDFLGSGRAKREEIPYLPADVVLPGLTPEGISLMMQGGRIREEGRSKAEVKGK